MQRKDHLSDDVIRIFHNAKGSVKNNVEKWVDNNDAQMANSEEPADVEWNSNSQRDHAAGEYEPLQERNTHAFSTLKEQDDSKDRHSEPAHENDIDAQIDEENRILLENEERMEDIEDIRSEYRGHIGDKR
ncbi:hypothetical protein JSQ81_17760 [Sporosarcina sp. Marseille-Q4063]|uniref:hypothetical protein n=1 Tax=Sporosarcina sp. Marseille-Q4063 TaxID=2810514 RepID=UPI001BAE8B71|nr:hypothetical protein [Sporosarcina sp. Marseille-Q4063]QUW21615.1 hypothetical protein JSQ81_17760 [Sporosarcina sp. Marseille-Q4063]